jgi:hypothetical protein
MVRKPHSDHSDRQGKPLSRSDQLIRRDTGYDQAMRGGKIEPPEILKGRMGVEYPTEDINPEDVPF